MDTMGRWFGLLLLVAVAVPATAAGPHLEPGAIVADEEADRAALVLLYVQSGHKDSQAVYVVRPVARCRDGGGPGWYAPRLTHELRSAPELEARARLGTLDPGAIPNTCADPDRPLAPSPRLTGWDRLVNGTLAPFERVTFPPFSPP